MKYIDADTIEQQVQMLHDEAKENIAKMDTEEYRQYWIGRMGAYSNVLTAIRGFRVTSLQQEQPEADLDFSMFAKEIDAVYNLPKEITENTKENPLNWEYAIARHFYELGKNSK